MKTGLVLEGGAMRGMFTAGVLDVFMKEGVGFEGCIGTSAGGIAGCNLKSRQMGRTIRYNKKYCRDPRYSGVRSLLFTGDLYSKDFAYGEIPERLDPVDKEAFSSNPMEFYVNCTDVHTGKPIYHLLEKGDRDDVTWMRASASMPLVSRVVKIDGFELLDGGMSDPIPLKFMESIGYEKNVVIRTQPPGFVKQPAGMMRLMKIALRKYPNMIRIMRDRHILYNEQLSYIDKRQEEGDVLLILPDAPLNIGKISHDPDELQRVYELGVDMGRRRLDDVRRFLERK